MLTRATLRNRPSSRHLLARVLETPELPAQIRALPPPLLGRLIDQVGLEDAGELVALATTEQLAQIFDDDLWRSAQAGEDERFDSERFLLWLEILLEAGEKVVADRLAELPEDLVTLALHRHFLVLPFDDLRAELSAGDDDAAAAEKAFENCLSEELDEYQLIWRGGEGFDTLLAALLALDRDHHALTVNLLERCAALASEYIADNGGLYEVLSGEEMLEADLAGDRELRRAERGYVAPSAAAAFLRLARQPSPPDAAFAERDPVTRAYFRELSRKPLVARPSPGGGERRDLTALLEASGVAREGAAAPAQLKGTAGAPEPLLATAMRELREVEPRAFEERSEELAYLSNVLMAAGGTPSEPLRPAEAVDEAVACVSFGLSLVSGGPAPTPQQAAALLAAHPCDALFRRALAFAAGGGRSPRKTDSSSLGRVRRLLTRLKI